MASRSPATCRCSRSSPASSTTASCERSSRSRSTASSKRTPESTSASRSSCRTRCSHPSRAEPVPFAASMSEHPMATHATGEVVGHVLEALGDAPDLAVLFVTAPHVGVLEDIARTVRELLHPGTLLGVTAVSVLGGDREVEEQPAITLWAARLGAPVTPVRLDASVPSIGIAVTGLDRELGADPQDRTLLLLADPFSMPVD